LIPYNICLLTIILALSCTVFLTFKGILRLKEADNSQELDGFQLALLEQFSLIFYFTYLGVYYATDRKFPAFVGIIPQALITTILWNNQEGEQNVANEDSIEGWQTTLNIVRYFVLL
jgi:hypothetical protein